MTNPNSQLDYIEGEVDSQADTERPESSHSEDTEETSTEDEDDFYVEMECYCCSNSPAKVKLDVMTPTQN